MCEGCGRDKGGHMWCGGCKGSEGVTKMGEVTSAMGKKLDKVVRVNIIPCQSME